MFIHISSYSKSLNKLFDKNRVGVIHSVFDNTINFLSDNRLIALTSNQGALTPMSIQLDCSHQQFKQLHAKQHDLVYVSSSGLTISSVHFDGKQAKSVDLSYPKFEKDISDKSLIQLKESIENMLVSKDSQGSLNKAYLSLLLQEEKDLNPLEQAFFNKLSLFSLTVDDADLISLVDSFIGFGEGL